MRQSDENGHFEDWGTVVYRVVPAVNMARYYRVDLAPSLFGDVALVRTWGRIGVSANVRVDLYGSRGAAELARARLLASKMAKGYGSPRPTAVPKPPAPRLRGQRELPFYGVVPEERSPGF